MNRRLLFAGTAFTASLLPACMAPQGATLTQRPSVNPPASFAAAKSEGVVVSRTTGKPEAFAAQPSVGKSAATEPAMPCVVVGESGPAPVPPGIVKEEPTPEFHQADHRQPEGPSLPMPESASPVVASPVMAPVTEPLPVVPPVEVPQEKPAERIVERPAPAPRTPQPEPIPDADGVIRAHDPVIRTGPLPLVEVPTRVPAETVPSQPIPVRLEVPSSPPNPAQETKAETAPTISAPVPVVQPPALPPGVIGTSVHQTNSAPETIPPLPMARPTEPRSEAGEAKLLQTVRAFQENRLAEAEELLKSFDPASQSTLRALMPVLVRLSQGELAALKADEIDHMVDQLAEAPGALRSRASLRARQLQFCREVHNFAHVEPFPAGHVFRPGDIVYLYMELENFSCVKDDRSGFAITLGTRLELKDATGEVVWKAEPKDEPDRVSTPPRDYYRNFRLCVPSVAPGTYTLRIQTTDQPTGRVLDRQLEMKIGSK